MAKNCDNCKHSANFPCGNPCSGCIVVGGRLSWEPKNFGAACKEFFEEHIGPATDEDNKEEKKMADNRKTKAQLMEELEQKNAEIAELKKELERSDQYDLCVDVGKQLRESIDGLVEGGLTEDQAWQAIMFAAGNAMKRPFM